MWGIMGQAQDPRVAAQAILDEEQRFAAIQLSEALNITPCQALQRGFGLVQAQFHRSCGNLTCMGSSLSKGCTDVCYGTDTKARGRGIDQRQLCVQNDLSTLSFWATSIYLRAWTCETKVMPAWGLQLLHPQ